MEFPEGKFKLSGERSNDVSPESWETICESISDYIRHLSVSQVKRFLEGVELKYMVRRTADSPDSLVTGSLMRRINRELHNQNLPKLPTAVLGSLVSGTRGFSDKESFEFKDAIDWDRGEFGDSESCFWTVGYSQAKEVFKERFDLRPLVGYKENAVGEDVGAMRCIAFPWEFTHEGETHEVLIMTNSYGVPSLDYLPRVAKAKLELPEMVHIRLLFDGWADKVMFCNRPGGHALGTQEALEALKSKFPVNHDPELVREILTVDIPAGDWHKCSIRGRYFPMDELIDIGPSRDHNREGLYTHRDNRVYVCREESGRLVKCDRCETYLDRDRRYSITENSTGTHHSSLCCECHEIISELNWRHELLESFSVRFEEEAHADDYEPHPDTVELATPREVVPRGSYFSVTGETIIRRDTIAALADAVRDRGNEPVELDRLLEADPVAYQTA